MSLKATLRKGVKTAFRAIDDVNRTLTYTSMSGTPVIDLVAGTSSMIEATYTLKLAAICRFSQKELDKDAALVVTDSKCLFPTEDLPVLAKTADQFVDETTGILWQVIRNLSDPASVVTILQVRAS